MNFSNKPSGVGVAASGAVDVLSGTLNAIAERLMPEPGRAADSNVLLRKPLPFARSNYLAERIQKIRAALSHNPVLMEMELRSLDPYRSRGKGGKHQTRNRTITGRWVEDRSKYNPKVCAAEGCR